MTIERKLLGTSPSGGATDVAEVFSTDLWDNVGSSNTVNSGLDSTDSDVMIWAKQRDGTSDHYLSDTVRGITKYIKSNANSAQSTNSGVFTSTSSTGYITGDVLGGSTQSYVGWQFKKQKKFFDIVTWTGNDVSGRTIAHGLDGPVGMILAKRTNASQDWVVWHKDLASTKYLKLNSTAAEATSTTIWTSTAPTSTVFSVGDGGWVNGGGSSYVAYVFADNSSEDAEEQMIKCGSYTGNSSATGPVVNLGWEPQWLLIKNTTSAENWYLFDNMRGIPTGGNVEYLLANSTAVADSPSNFVDLNSTGFQLKQSGTDVNANGNTYIYMAIRAPMMIEPEAATDVFALLKETSANLNQTPRFKQVSNFPVDFVVNKKFVSAGNWWSGIRLTNSRVQLDTSASGETAVGSTHEFDYNDGVGVGGLTGSSDFMSYMWKRAKGYFDIVAYPGNSTSGRTVAHSLGVTPEMMWVRRRNGSGEFKVYHSVVGPTKYMVLNTTDTQTTLQHIWNNTAPTSTVFTLGNDSGVNTNSNTYVAFLFATLDGISKVGSFVGNGSSQTIDCGFSAGARFVIIKNIQAANHSWILFDSARGIVAGNDSYLQVNKTIEETTNIDPIDPHNSGFIVNNNSEVNTSSQTYLFYAIA